MAEDAQPIDTEASGAPPASEAAAPESTNSAAYEIIRQRLNEQAFQLSQLTGQLDGRRAEVFGSIGSKLLKSDRILTEHNCTPRDMMQLGDDRGMHHEPETAGDRLDL